MKSGSTSSVKTGVGALVGAALMLGLSFPSALESHAASIYQQEPGGRFRVLVVPLACNDVDKKFGEKVAKSIRENLEDFSTHAPIPENEFKRALKRYEVKQEDLNAIRARQLANLMGAQVVYYGECAASGASYQVDAGFIDVTTGDEVAVPPVSIRDKSDESVESVAQASIQAFEQQVRFVRARQFCADYVGSQQPDNALRNCNEALEINANSIPALFNKGLAFRQLYENEESGGTDGWADSAVYYFERVLEQDPGRREALQNAAYIYSQIGEAEKASELYRQYLELDPANVPVRLKVAYDMAQADLMAEAISIIQEGLQFSEENVDLLQSLGDYSLRYSEEDSTYVDIALEAYEQVLSLKGEETDQAIIENALAAYTRANRSKEAITFAERALESHSDSPRLWSLYADALGRDGRFADASAAMDRVVELDASYPNAYLKRGQFKLQGGQDQAAMADFNLAIQSGSSAADVYMLFYSTAHVARNERQYARAVSYFERAVEFAPADRKQDLEFWWGYTFYQLGEDLAKPEDANLSQLQRAQQNFQAALAHFNRAGSVRREIPQLKDAADRWLLNVDARIRQIQRG